MRSTCMILILSGGLLANNVRGTVPVTGLPVEELQWVDLAMQTYMEDNGIPSGVIGIMVDGKIIYQRGFGWFDSGQTVPMPENALVRIASCSKPITAAAVQKLILDGDLALDMPMFGDPKAPVHQHVAPRYIKQSPKEVGIPNMVTSVLASYRGYDTLGEVTVIFTAGIGVLALLSRRQTTSTPKRRRKRG